MLAEQPTAWQNMAIVAEAVEREAEAAKEKRQQHKGKFSRRGRRRR